MKLRITLFTVLLIAAALLVTGCTQTVNEPAPSEGVASETTEEVTESATEAPQESPAPTEEVVVETAEQTSEPSPEVTEETGEAVEIIHQSQPNVPVYSQTIPSECNTGHNFNTPGFDVQPPCDSWQINLLERAVSADLSEFYAYLDILTTRSGKSGDWFYLSLDLFGGGMPEDGQTLTYFFEIDLDQNGRGDILIAVENLDLDAAEWTVTGVKAYQDLNEDVGGVTAVRANENNTGNGYETLIFDEGVGDDPDLVWARRAANQDNRIEFAFKPELLGGSSSFMWWAGAMHGSIDPQSFDLVDSQSESDFYEIDTTCGWVYGHTNAYNIKKCYVAPAPTEVTQPGSPATQPTEGPDPVIPEPTEDVCVQPPHPDPENNCWVWRPDLCQWVCYN